MLENSVVVKSLSDLPAPVANEIILLSGSYEWIGNIDLEGDTLVIDGVNVRICGQGTSFSSIIELTNKAIDIKSGVLNLENISMISSSTTNTAIEIDAGATLIFESGYVSGFGVGVDSIQASLESINRVQFVGQEIAGVRFNGVSTGVSSVFLCDFKNYIADAVKFADGSKLDQFLLSSTGFSAGVGTVAISGETAGANVDIRGVVNTCTFNGDGDPLSGITEKDVKFEFSNCFGVFNSTDYGFMDYDNPSLNTTTVADGSWLPIAAVAASWTVEAESARFAEDTDGVIEYTGINKNVGECSFEVSCETGTGVSNNYELGVSVDGAEPTPLSIIPIEITSAGRIAAWSFPTTLDVTGKTWELKIQGVGTTTVVVFKSAHVRVKRV
jgi:hypothetical protein